MYVDRSFCGYPNKDKFIDELNFTNCMHLNRKTTSKFVVGITYKNINSIIRPEYFDANNIFSYPFIQNIKHKPNMVQELSRKMKIALKNRDQITVSNRKHTKYYASLVEIAKQNNVDGRMRKTKFYYNQVG